MARQSSTKLPVTRMTVDRLLPMTVALLHPDKQIALQGIVEKNRKARKRKRGKQAVRPKKSYLTAPKQDGSAMLQKLAYRLHDRRFSDHYARLAEAQPPSTRADR